MNIENNSSTDDLTFKNITFDMTSVGDCNITSRNLFAPPLNIVLDSSLVQILTEYDGPRKMEIETDGAVIIENQFDILTLASFNIEFDLIIACNEFINKDKHVNCILCGDVDLSIINVDSSDNELFNYNSIDNLNVGMFQVTTAWTGKIVLRGLNNAFAKQYLLDNNIITVIDGSASDLNFTWDEKYLTICIK